MKKIKINYGKTGIIISVPDTAKIIHTNYQSPVENEKESIIDALHHPIGSRSLSEIVRAGSKVVITHSDITRATPNNRLLPVILEEIESYGVRREDIALINALGTHRKQTPQELMGLLGERIYNSYYCKQHDAFDDTNLVKVGITSNGNPIRLNKTLIEADVKILTGFIEPHFFAGFSGGPKAILPALAGAESVFSNHNYKMISDPQATFFVTDGNPIWEEMKEAALMVENSFLVNVTLNRDQMITGVFSGDVIKAHKQGCEHVRSSSIVDLDQYFDLVITSNSGYPLDQNLYQCVKGLAAAKRAVRKGGGILMVAECADGFPNHGSYRDLLCQANSPSGILDIISKTNFREQDSWQVQIQAYVQQFADVYLFSEGLSNDDIIDAQLNPVQDINLELHGLIKKYGDRVCVIPEGPLVISNYIDSEIPPL